MLQGTNLEFSASLILLNFGTVDPSVPLGGSEPVWNQTGDANNEWSDQEQG